MKDGEVRRTYLERPKMQQSAVGKDLTISIGTLDNYCLLERCLRSIYRGMAKEVNFEIRVVYNGSGNPDIVKSIRDNFPDVILTSLQGPLGYCAPHNLVLSEARGRYIVLLDDDTVISAGAFSQLIAFMDAHLDVGLVGCRTLNADHSLQKSYGMFPSLKSEFRNVFVADSFWRDGSRDEMHGVQDVDWLNGSFMMVRASVVQAVGGLDEYYYTLVCESDWCFRIKKAGWKIVYVPSVEIIHDGGQHSRNRKYTTTNYANLMRYHVNRFYFFRKHYAAHDLFLLRFIMAVGALLRLVYYVMFYVRRKDLREVAMVRMKIFRDVIKLSFSTRPHEMPKSIVVPIPSSGESKMHSLA